MTSWGAAASTFDHEASCLPETREAPMLTVAVGGRARQADAPE